MSASLGKVLKYAGMLGIGVLLLTLAMRGVDDPQALWDDTECQRLEHWRQFVMGYLAIVSRGMRWLILLEPLGHQPKMSNSIHAVAFSYFSNAFVPRAGNWPGVGRSIRRMTFPWMSSSVRSFPSGWSISPCCSLHGDCPPVQHGHLFGLQRFV